MTDSKLHVVDSCGWLEYFADSKYAEDSAILIEDTSKLLVPTICIHEVFKVVLREKTETEALTAISIMNQSRIVALDIELSMLAAKISLIHKIPTADSIVYATAKLFGAKLYTQDKHLKDLPNVIYFEKK
jgi:predicted nucleic acid-binding protein